MFVCEQVQISRGNRRLFDGLGFCLKEGGALTVTGANGSGKTTLLKALAGLVSPDEGRITWQGEDVSRSENFRKQVNYIGHKSALKQDLSVYDNIQFWAAMRGTPMLVEAAIHFFELWPMVDMLIHQLSAGWQRKVALARLIAIPTHIWILDEPFANLDKESTERMEGLIATRVKQGGVVVFTTHQPQTLAPELHLPDFMPELKTLAEEEWLHVA